MTILRNLPPIHLFCFMGRNGTRPWAIRIGSACWYWLGLCVDKRPGRLTAFDAREQLAKRYLAERGL